MPWRGRPANRFVGRELELDALESGLDNYPLVTLWGPPGVGKSRLANELCSRLATGDEGLPHTFVALAPARSLADVLSILSHSLRLKGQAEPNDRDQLGRLLAERGPQLIVLDNVEQVAAEASELLAGWLEQAPDTRWLVTSRQRLGLSNEHVLETKPLNESDAIELFADRARQADPSFSLTPTSRSPLALLVERLDYLPLAIELCAARSRVLSIEQLLAELSCGFGLLAASLEGGPRGLNDAITSSWAALSAAEQSTLAQCAAFVSPFTAQAAASVVDLAAFPGAPAPIDIIRALLDRSLLVPADSESDGARRFRMLLCIAEFARSELLASGKQNDLFRRHAVYFTKLGRTLSEATLALQDMSARAALEQARHEFAAVHERALNPEYGLAPSFAVKAAIALAPWYRRFGPYAPLLEIIDRALAAAPELHPALECKVLGVRGATLCLLGRLDEAQSVLERATALAHRWPPSSLPVMIESELTLTELYKGDYESAQRREERVLALCKTLGLRVQEGQALLWLGVVRYSVDDLDEALRWFEQALVVVRDVGDRVFECEALYWLALVELELGRRRSARAHFEEALAAIERIDERRWRPHTLSCYAILEQEEGNYLRAMSLYSEAIAESSWVGSWGGAAMHRGYMGTCLLEQGALDEARAELQRAIDDLGGLKRAASRALFRACISVIDTLCGDTDTAERELALARAELDRSPEQVFFRRATEIHAGHLELARAREAARVNELTESEALYANAKALLERRGFEQTDVRFARRMLERALSGWVPPRRPAIWRIHETGLWFEPPYRARVELGRRHALRRLLVVLAREQINRRNAPLPPAELIAAGWPGERIQQQAAGNRLRVALHTLRRMGLQGLLITQPDGYRFDPKASLALVAS